MADKHIKLQEKGSCRSKLRKHIQLQEKGSLQVQIKVAMCVLRSGTSYGRVGPITATTVGPPPDLL